jgi:hypothetical protein
MAPAAGWDHGRVAAGRRSKSLGDMLRTLAVLGVAVGIMYLFIPHTSRGGPALQSVNYQVAVHAYSSGATEPALSPSRLPTGWVCTHAQAAVAGGALSVGFYDRPDNAYVLLTESAGPRSGFLVGQGVHGPARGTVSAGGRTYVLRETRQGPDEVALELTGPGRRTVLVGGGAPVSALIELAGLLAPVSG